MYYKLHDVKGKKIIVKGLRTKVMREEMMDVFKPIVSDKLKMNKKFALSKHYDCTPFDLRFTGYEDHGKTLFFEVIV